MVQTLNVMHLSIVALYNYLKCQRGYMTIFDRYAIGRKLGLDNDETHEIVDELEQSGKIKTPLGSTVVLSREARDMLDSEKGIA